MSEPGTHSLEEHHIGKQICGVVKIHDDSWIIGTKVGE
jgi:hypothetical protein